jgi:hypothetical protein
MLTTALMSEEKDVSFICDLVFNTIIDQRVDKFCEISQISCIEVDICILF